MLLPPPNTPQPHSNPILRNHHAIFRGHGNVRARCRGHGRGRGSTTLRRSRRARCKPCRWQLFCSCPPSLLRRSSPPSRLSPSMLDASRASGTHRRPRNVPRRRRWRQRASGLRHGVDTLASLCGAVQWRRRSARHRPMRRSARSRIRASRVLALPRDGRWGALPCVHRHLHRVRGRRSPRSLFRAIEG